MNIAELAFRLATGTFPTRQVTAAALVVEEALGNLAEGVQEALAGRPASRPDLVERAREIERRSDLPPEVAAIARVARELLESEPDDPHGLSAYLGIEAEV